MLPLNFPATFHIRWLCTSARARQKFIRLSARGETVSCSLALHDLSTDRHNDPRKFCVVGVDDDGTLQWTNAHFFRDKSNFHLIAVSVRSPLRLEVQARNIGA